MGKLNAEQLLKDFQASRKPKPRNMTESERALARHYSQSFLPDSPFSGTYPGTAMAVKDSLAVSKFDPNATPSIKKDKKEKETDYINKYINTKREFTVSEDDSLSPSELKIMEEKNRMIRDRNKDLRKKAKKQEYKKNPKILVEDINTQAQAYSKMLMNDSSLSREVVQAKVKAFLKWNLEQNGLKAADFNIE